MYKQCQEQCLVYCLTAPSPRLAPDKWKITTPLPCPCGSWRAVGRGNMPDPTLGLAQQGGWLRVLYVRHGGLTTKPQQLRAGSVSGRLMGLLRVNTDLLPWLYTVHIKVLFLWLFRPSKEWCGFHLPFLSLCEDWCHYEMSFIWVWDQGTVTACP